MEHMGTQDQRLARQLTNTSQDQAIREKLNSLLSTESSKLMVKNARAKLEDFMSFSLKNTDNERIVHQKYVQLLPELAKTFKSHVASGEDNLKDLKEKKGVIVVSNHLGLGVLTIIDNQEGKYSVPLKEFAGFPVRLSALNLLSEKLEKPLFETAIELPEPLLAIQKATSTITVPIDGTGRTQKLIENTSLIISEKDGAIVVMYPEGGTSGKRNNGGPYDLDEFHSGAFVVAQNLNLPILPVCQVLNPQNGLELHILKPIDLKSGDSEYLRGVMQSVKVNMQEKLDSVS